MARCDGTGGAGESEEGESQILNIKYQISNIKEQISNIRYWDMGNRAEWLRGGFARFLFVE